MGGKEGVGRGGRAGGVYLGGRWVDSSSRMQTLVLFATRTFSCLNINAACYIYPKDSLALAPLSAAFPSKGSGPRGKAAPWPKDTADRRMDGRTYGHTHLDVGCAGMRHGRGHR